MIPFVLAATEGWTNPVIVVLIGLAVGAPATVLGIKGYRRAQKLDEAAAQAATLAAKGDEIQRAFDAFDRIVDNLQVDNREVRQHAADLRRRLGECNEELRRMAGRSS